MTNAVLFKINNVYHCGELSICYDKVKSIKYLVQILDNLSVAFVYGMVEHLK